MYKKTLSVGRNKILISSNKKSKGDYSHKINAEGAIGYFENMAQKESRTVSMCLNEMDLEILKKHT